MHEHEFIEVECIRLPGMYQSNEKFFAGILFPYSLPLAYLHNIFQVVCVLIRTMQ